MNCAMSAIGTKRTSATALQMSAFGGKADMMQTGRVTPFRFYSSPSVLRRIVKRGLQCPLVAQSGHFDSTWHWNFTVRAWH
jgi:hypothetical protein